MRIDPTKAQRRRLRELAALAHERELARELGQLEADFRQWRASEFDVHELNERVHRFHQGPSRDLYSFYTRASPAVVVATALAAGTISEEEVGQEIVALLRDRIEFARDELTAARDIDE